MINRLCVFWCFFLAEADTFCFKSSSRLVYSNMGYHNRVTLLRCQSVFATLPVKHYHVSCDRTTRAETDSLTSNEMSLTWLLAWLDGVTGRVSTFVTPLRRQTVQPSRTVAVNDQLWRVPPSLSVIHINGVLRHKTQSSRLQVFVCTPGVVLFSLAPQPLQQVSWDKECALTYVDQPASYCCCKM